MINKEIYHWILITNMYLIIIKKLNKISPTSAFIVNKQPLITYPYRWEIQTYRWEVKFLNYIMLCVF